MRLFIFVLLIQTFLTAQNRVHGKIIDSATNKPLAAANVFIANTTYQTLTNENGQFSIYAPEGNFQLAVTYVGYESVVYTNSKFPDSKIRYVIPLTAEVNNLKSVTILSDKQREKYLKIFLDNFLGTSKNAKKCKILNLDDINIDVADNGALEITAANPLQIENPELNYHLTFLLTSCSIDFTANVTHYIGYPSFRDLNAKAKVKKINRRRVETYQGSTMHFIRSVFADDVRMQGFIVNSYKKMPNPDYPHADTVKAIYALAHKTGNFERFMKLPSKDLLYEVEKNIPTAQYTATTDTTKFLVIKEYLQITFTENEEEEYIKHSHKKHNLQISVLYAPNQQIEIFPTGNYAQADGFIFNGYMGWKKVGDLLPFDYLPE